MTTTSYISSSLKGSGIEFDFFQPHFYPAKYRDIISHIVRDPTKGAIAGGYFTKYLAKADREDQGIDIYVFIPPVNTSAHAFENSKESLARAEQLNSFLTYPIVFLPFIKNPHSQPFCESSIKRFYVTRDFWAPFYVSETKSASCQQQVTVRFTNLQNITQLISSFDYEPCKIGYRANAIHFGKWFLYGGSMNPNNSAAPDLICKYEKKGFLPDFNSQKAIDVNALIE